MSFSSTPARRAVALCFAIGAFMADIDGRALAAPSATLSPTDDSYVTSKYSARNFGTSTRLVVTRRPASRAYLRFTLGSAPAQGFSATLRIYPLTSSKKGLRLRRVTDSGWAERSLTYGSAPAADRAVVRSGRLRAHRWKSINVTRLVNERGVLSVAMATSGRQRIVLASRENRKRAPRLIVRNPAGTTSVTPSTSPSPAAGPEPGAAPDPVPPPPPSPPASEAVIAAAGDIANSPTSGDVSAKLLDTLNLDAVLTLGDNAYQSGTMSEFKSYYDPTWGRHNAKVKPAPGNHEYNSGGTGYFDYFGALAGPRGNGYYSFDIGGWHLIALNSNVARDAGSAQVAWLRNDLASHSTQCTLAYWHHPRWNIGTKGDDASQAGLWDTLYDAGADVVLVGHDHNYQRYYRQNKTGARDDARGIRQFTVGTGGASHYGVSLKPPAEVVNADTFGVLKPTLRPGSYNWQFLPEAGKTFTDSGSESCH